MYPNQGFPGQYPPAVPFGSGMPQPMQMGQPGYPPMPQPSFGQQYGQPMMPSYDQAPQMPSYGQAPQMPSYGQGPQMPPFGQGPQMPSYGQAPQMPSYGQAPQMPSYGQGPQMPSYGQAPQPANNFASAPSAYPQLPPQQPQFQGQIPPQQEHVSQMHYASSQSSPQMAKRGRPTVLPAQNFNASNDAAALRKAMKGFGTDEDGIINVLCRRPCHQRVEIVRTYKTAYGKDLIDDIRSETSGNFETLLVALLTPKVEYYCRELYEAMAGAGTDEDALIEVMCAMSNAEIREICYAYQRLYGQNLENQLRSDTSGSMKRLMTSLSVGGRDESMMTDVNAARADAESLKRAGVGRFGTDESEFNRILCLRNYEQLKLVCQEYERLTGNSLEKDIKREFSGDIEDALLAIIRVANNRPEFFARRLHKSMAGLGTNDRSLIRLCVMRCEIDMMDIKDEFQRYYGKSLKSFIKGDTSGHYKHALYALCGENRS